MIKSVRWLCVHCVVILCNLQILSDSCYTMKMAPTFVNRREAIRRMWLIEVFIVLTIHSLSQFGNVLQAPPPPSIHTLCVFH